MKSLALLAGDFRGGSAAAAAVAAGDLSGGASAGDVDIRRCGLAAFDTVTVAAEALENDVTVLDVVVDSDSAADVAAGMRSLSSAQSAAD